MGKINNISYCNETICFKLSLKYSKSQTDISSLIRKSDKCHQELKFQCFGSRLSQFGSWTDRNGKYHKYFTDIDKNKCECAKNNSCFKIGKILTASCNCDHGDPVQRQDTIILTDKVCFFS